MHELFFVSSYSAYLLACKGLIGNCVCLLLLIDSPECSVFVPLNGSYDSQSASLCHSRVCADRYINYIALSYRYYCWKY